MNEAIAKVALKPVVSSIAWDIHTVKLNAVTEINNTPIYLTPTISNPCFCFPFDKPEAEQVKYLQTEMRVRPDQVMTGLLPVFDFDFSDVKANGILAFVQSKTAELVEEKKKKRIIERTHTWNHSSLVTCRVEIEQAGGVLSYASRDEYVNSDRSHGLYATFTAKSVKGREYTACICASESKDGLFDVEIGYRTKFRGMKLSNAIKRATDELKNSVSVEENNIARYNKEQARVAEVTAFMTDHDFTVKFESMNNNKFRFGDDKLAITALICEQVKGAEITWYLVISSMHDEQKEYSDPVHFSLPQLVSLFKATKAIVYG